jgi:hypothetical protein
MVKGTVQRDIYVNALRKYSEDTPIEQWPTTGDCVSKSGIARELRAMGFASFDRKRLDSPGCRAIVQGMNARLRERFAHTAWSVAHAATSKRPEGRTSKHSEQQLLSVQRQLELALRREKHWKDLCTMLRTELKNLRRQQGAFEKHCEGSLRSVKF